MKNLSMASKILPLLAPLLAASCASNHLLPGAAEVTITRIRADVVNCQELGTVTTHGSYTNASIATGQLRNETVTLGGNTLFVLDDRAFTLARVPESGAAYRCP